MIKKDATFTVGEFTTKFQYNVFESIPEAVAKLGEKEVLKMIDYVYGTRQKLRYRDAIMAKLGKKKR